MVEQSAMASSALSKTRAFSSTTSAPLADGPASGFGQPSRGATRRISVSPKLSIARAALPIFWPSWGRTRTMTGGSAPIADRAGNFREIARLAEVLVDAGEANVGDVIERLEAIHHGLADLACIDLIPAGFELALDRGDEPVEALGRNIALAAGDREGPGQLLAVERLALAVLLDHRQVAQLDALKGRETRAAGFALAPPANRCAILARPAVFHLAVFVRAEWAAHPLSLIDWKAGAELANPFVDGPLHASVVVRAVAGKAVEDVGHHVGNIAELGRAEAAGRARRGTDADAAGLDWRQRIEGDPVLVAGDPRMLEALVGVLAGQAERPQVDQRVMGIGAAGDQVCAAFLQTAS